MFIMVHGAGYLIEPKIEKRIEAALKALSDDVASIWPADTTTATARLGAKNVLRAYLDQVP